MKVFCLIILFVSLLVNTSCKRYPEGGDINMCRSNLFGSWRLSLYEVNGIDSTNLIKYNNKSEGYKNVTFRKNVSTITLEVPSSPTRAVDFEDGNLKLKFTNKEITGLLCHSTDHCYRSFLVPEVTQENPSATWAIRKLSSNEMVLTLFQKNTYKIRLYKK